MTNYNKNLDILGIKITESKTQTIISFGTNSFILIDENTVSLKSQIFDNVDLFPIDIYITFTLDICYEDGEDFFTVERKNYINEHEDDDDLEYKFSIKENEDIEVFYEEQSQSSAKAMTFSMLLSFVISEAKRRSSKLK